MFDHAIALSQSAMLTTGIILGPVLVASLLVGLLVGLFQATTSIQDMTLSFMPKLIVVGVMIYLAGPWFLRLLITFTQNDLSSFWHVTYLP
ncbi:MAG: flagellar type III secretion system protein FliQ [Sulfobacillus thermosulfidooxidans]|uniref:Flagellar biosynthetic protein FliQ n=1 Tax=Sulfobacillus thermotolerans TaxID=338644 RepID=A0ABM6RU15_9FIRM|nr:flagellar biosynthetic protein FliQ [Sulfobacillus sp. hq2]AUW94969.1 flagellar biosynthetic protein FliQ [Sulfobacillus thermotolerans]MCY0908195.1 flagellar biosynthetic protein FliQ [Sulfobacillus thermotolerans]POB10428.1 flagellar biosynthetic protein FliQ [Sulfobacillus sp. hq2]PSR36621.1 MAG: flagellar type III secretion system protein FliQ [Sulfobacillus thermosulfidooxidans]